MKKTICILLAAACWLALPSTSTAQRLRFGLKAGAGVAKFDYQPDNAADTFSTHFYGNIWYERNAPFRPTFSLGGVLEYDLNKDFLLSSGVQFSLKSSKTDIPDMYNTWNYRFHVVQLQIPVNVHYRLKRFFLGAGGYFCSSVSGRYKNVKTSNFPSSGPTVFEESGQLKFGSDTESNLQRFDFGVRGELGYGLKRTRLSIAFEQGFVNGLPKESVSFGQQTTRQARLRNQAITASLAYYWLAK